MSKVWFKPSSTWILCLISDWSDEEPSDTDIDSSEQEEDEEDQANESFI